MPFVAPYMDLEIITLSEVRHRKTNIVWYHLYVVFKENDINELKYKTETEPQTQNTNYDYQREKSWGKETIRSLELADTSNDILSTTNW